MSPLRVIVRKGHVTTLSDPASPSQSQFFSWFGMLSFLELRGVWLTWELGELQGCTLDAAADPRRRNNGVHTSSQLGPLPWEASERASLLLLCERPLTASQSVCLPQAFLAPGCFDAL